MAGTNNFLVFNEANNPTFTMSDADYYADLYRLNGLIPMIADPIAHNKMYRQWSIMISAMAGLIASMNYNASDADLATLQANLKSTIEDVAEAKVDTRITTLENWKSSITATPAEINILDGVTASTSELNILDGLTASTSELNILHGITASTAELNILDGVTASTAELNILDGLTASTSELNTLHGITASTSELNTLHGITASTAELNTLDGVTVTSTEINYLDGANSNIQQQINNLSISALIPFRQDSTAYAVGDVVKIAGLSPFQYLECIATGTSASGLPPFNRTTGYATQDGTVIWLVCDMRDGLQVGDMKYRFSNTDLAGYIKDNQTILHFDQQNPIENATNWRLLRLFRLILNQALLQYAYPSLFLFNVMASINTASTNPILLNGAGIVIINQWCNLTPTNLTTIEDITLQDYIDISAYNTANSVSYTEAQYKQTAQTLLTDILAGSGGIIIRVSNIENRFIKLQNNIAWISRLEEEGLPDITGSLGSLVSGSNANTNPSSGALKWGGRNTYPKCQAESSPTSNLWFDPEFKASDSNAIYGNSAHVLPANIHLCPFIKY